jgi:hypothetical protein
MLNGLKKNRFYKFVIGKSRKLKWIEMLGIAVFFFILLVAFLFLSRRSKDIIVTVRILDSNSQPSFYNFPRQLFLENLKSGLKEKSQLGGTVLEVLDVYKYPSSDVNQDVFVTLKISSVYNRQTGEYSFDNLPLLIGDYRTFQLQDIVFSGVIIDINTTGKPKEQKMFSVTGFLDPVNNNDSVSNEQVAIFNGVNTNGIKNFLADQIKPGLKILDSNGQTAAEISSVNKTPGKVTFLQSGRFASADDPDTKHIEITLNILADKVGDSYFFQKEQSLTIGSPIFLSFENLKITLTITSVTTTN